MKIFRTALFNDYTGNTEWQLDSNQKHYKTYVNTININGYEVVITATGYPLSVANHKNNIYPLYNFNFSVNGKGSGVHDTGGNQFKILNAVANSIQRFVELYNPEKISVIGESVDESRIAIYRKLLQRFMRNNNYTMKEHEYDENAEDDDTITNDPKMMTMFKLDK